MVLGKVPVLGRSTTLVTVGQGPIALAVGAGGVLWTLLLSSILSLLSPSLWETARYRLKYCLKGPLNQKKKQKKKQPTNRSHTFGPTFLLIKISPLENNIGDEKRAVTFRQNSYKSGFRFLNKFGTMMSIL